MWKWAYFVLFVGAGAFGLIALFSTVASHANEQAKEAAAGPTLKLVATNFKLDQPEYTVKAGEKMTVKLQVKEGIHAIEIKGTNIHLDKQNTTTEYTFDKPGTYLIECVLPCGIGHENMKSKLIVQ